jgi:hypothetical protein
LFRGLAKVDVTHVPFQPAAATNAVVSGQVPIASTSMPPAVPFAKTGKVRPIAVMSLKRSPALPDVPTVAELGYKDFEANTWFAVFAPAKTPAAVLDSSEGIGPAPPLLSTASPAGGHWFGSSLYGLTLAFCRSPGDWSACVLSGSSMQLAMACKDGQPCVTNDDR